MDIEKRVPIKIKKTKVRNKKEAKMLINAMRIFCDFVEDLIESPNGYTIYLNDDIPIVTGKKGIRFADKEDYWGVERFVVLLNGEIKWEGEDTWIRAMKLVRNKDNKLISKKESDGLGFLCHGHTWKIDWEIGLSLFESTYESIKKGELLD